MSDYKIEKNIPLPPTARPSNRFRFGEMEVGDSFQVDADDVAQARTAASWYGKRNDMKFTIRRYKDGFRCWRKA